MKYEPSNLEILLTRLAFIFFGKAIYREYTGRLPLKGDEKVLDFGSGMGTVAYYTLKRLPYGHLTCSDVSLKWISACKKTLRKNQNISFLQGDIYIYDLLKDYFDLIYCHFVLHDIPDEELIKIIPTLAGILKTKGFLAFREPLEETRKINLIQSLLEQNQMSNKDSRISRTPLMGLTLESLYIKN